MMQRRSFIGSCVGAVLGLIGLRRPSAVEMEPVMLVKDSTQPSEVEMDYLSVTIMRPGTVIDIPSGTEYHP